MAYDNIRTFSQCVSVAEQGQRVWVTFVNVLGWMIIIGLIFATFGMILLVALFAWLLSYIYGEYNVRRIQAVGATVSQSQMPEVHRGVVDICERFNMAQSLPRVIIIPGADINAIALRFARRRVVVLFSELLAGVIDKPAELRFLLGHEICHHALDFGARGFFELYKPARYKQGRELTCDNAGLVAAGDLEEAKTAIKMLCVGRFLHERLSDEALITESRYIYSGCTGWLLGQYLTHPPAGTRVENLDIFHNINI